MSNQRLGNLLQVPPGDMEPLVRRVLDRIDAIHDVSGLPQMPIVYTNDPLRFGGYMPERAEYQRQFALSRSGPYPELTLTHEIGHLLDHALGDFLVYLSSEPASMFSEVRQAMENSRAISSLRASIQFSPGLLQTHRFQILYWLAPQEQWARAYAQFIAVRSQDSVLLQNIEKARLLDGPDVFHNVQWDEDDFAPIALAIEAMFRKSGWIE